MKKKKFSTTWKRSVQPRKQRKYRYEAPLHVRQKFMNVHLSPELRKKHNKRNVQLRKEDKVKVLTGQFKKKEGKVERIDLKREKVFITGMEKIKKDGTKLLVGMRPSNLMITELRLEDKKRKQKLEPKGAKK
ncbi:MAG: 50S ribosomal protein L24 [Candidatus Woesearchaeota archaeon]